MLKKAIDYIRHLQMKNEQLIEHNKLLQKQISCKSHYNFHNFVHYLLYKNYSSVFVLDLNHKLAATTAAAAAATVTASTPSPQTSDTGIDSPISLDDDLQPYSASHNGAHSVSQPNVMQNGQGLMATINDGARLFSCFLLIVCLFFNPFQSSFSPSSNTMHYGRSLLQEEEMETGVPTFYWLILWIVRLLIASVSFGGLMIWSRCKIQAQSKTAFSFWRHEKQAQLDLNEVWCILF